MSARRFFLARSGQIFGPYSEEEIETLRESGEYPKYTWFWHPASARWQPIDPPPAPPIATTEATTEAKVARLVARATLGSPASPSGGAPIDEPAFTLPDESLSPFSVLCYDPVCVLAGMLRGVTDGGCEFITSDGGTSPAFGLKSPVVMNILDGRTGRTMGISGRVGPAVRRNGSWQYRIFWKRCPEILRENPSSRPSMTAPSSFLAK